MARADRNGQRAKRSNFQTRRPDLGYYFIVTDTKETEANYMKGLRDSLPEKLQGRIVIKVSATETERLVETCRDKAALEPQYGEPWIVFDRDRVTNFDSIIARAEREGIHVGWSNPCIEIWFDSYFGKMHSYQDSVRCCSGFSQTYTKKTGQDYQKAEGRIYSILNKYGSEEKAVQLAESRYNEHIQNGYTLPSKMCPCTTVHRLVSEIREKAERGGGKN